MSYITIKAAGHSTAAALVAAFLTCFGKIKIVNVWSTPHFDKLMFCIENGLVANNRLILLDSPLLFFIAFTTMAWMKFCDPRLQPFSSQWKIWLLLTGVGLGCSLSSKWVGLFTIATIGCSTAKGLWDIWGDLSVSPYVFGRHFVNRAYYLILVPAVIYLISFGVHFAALKLPGDGDTHMSAAFQQTLIGNEVPPTFAGMLHLHIRALNLYYVTNGLASEFSKTLHTNRSFPLGI
jgi:dolichyl-phosphate-mannose-protein mannosyltransferase